MNFPCFVVFVLALMYADSNAHWLFGAHLLYSYLVSIYSVARDTKGRLDSRSPVSGDIRHSASLYWSVRGFVHIFGVIHRS
jgi:hypothetical protein